MPKTEVVFFSEGDGSVPTLRWLDKLPPKAQTKLIVKVEQLAACGHELRRPAADFLRDGIYELRVRHMHVNYRILYFFHAGRAVLSHGLTKTDVVPDADIERALSRREAFMRDPERHTHSE